MPHTPIALNVPKACRDCGSFGTVKLQQSIKGDRVVLQWCCTLCKNEWPVVRADQVLQP